MLGEREAVHCGHARACILCHEYYALSLRKSGFALGTSRLPAHLTFNKAMQVQIGGLQGAMHLAAVSGDPEAKASADIAGCFERLKSHTPDFENLDFSVIVPYIQKFSLRKRRGEQ